MKEVINSILEAEKKTEELLKVAGEKSNQILMSADEQADKIKLNVINEVKELRKEIVAKAESQADVEYAKILEEGKASTEKLKNSTSDKINDSVEFVVRSILD